MTFSKTSTSHARRGRRASDAPVERRNRDVEVIDAATAVMSERGYGATSIQEIADRVGVLKGSLYHYFSSKEDLLFRVISESQAESDQITAEVAALRLEPIDELSEFLRRLCVWYLTHVERANIFFTETRHLTGNHRKAAQQHGREFVEHLHELIVAAKEKGQLGSELEPVILTRYVLGSLNNVRTWPSRSLRGISREELADAFVTLTRSALQASETQERSSAK